MLPHIASKRKSAAVGSQSVAPRINSMLVRRSVALPAVAIVFLSVALWSWAQQAPAADVAGEVRTALSGRWAGVLEYRDYKEPASSLKRVALPTWLQVQTAGTAQSWHYVYDDGPNKVVEEEEQVALDATLGTVTIAEPGEAPQVYKATGFSTLKAGRGTLVLSGTITDNNKPAEARLTLTIGRNMVDLLQEVRPAGTDEAFVFRHEHRFVRTETPVVTAK